MKYFLLALSLFAFNAWSQDPATYLNNFDAKIYSLKTKGVKDFVVDIHNEKLTQQLNDQMIFGKVDQVIFRTYWTANPERIAIELVGLPDGFKEIKEELKLSIMSIMDSLLPIPTMQKFAGYKFQSGAGPNKDFVAQDATGLATVQSYILRFDNTDKLIEVIGKKAVGELLITPKYEKESFADGKLVLKSLHTSSSQNGQTLLVKKDLSYGTSQGLGVLNRVRITTEQSSSMSQAKPLILEETIEFKNYKINNGDALKYFLGEGSKATP